MKRINKILACTLAASVVATSAASLAGCGKGSKDKFTFWLSPNTDLLLEYNKRDLTLNPVIQYVQNKFDIEFEFIVPPKGEENTQFTTLTSGDFPDIMELTYYSGSVADLVKDGVAADLTKYIYPDSGESYFPNYKSVLDGDLDVKNTIRSLDNHYYSLAVIDDAQRTPWGGYMYRKDLIYKYATATDAEGEADPSAWTDKEDIKFPSGAKAPDLISDWDWMLKILKRAVDAGDLNYCMSLFYHGYLEPGDMVSAWGVSGSWYKENVNGKTQIKYGPTTDAFKSYVEKMKEWYDKGYIDKNFTSKKDIFYSTDGSSLASGKIGCFYGLYTYLGNELIDDGGVVDKNIDLRACYMPRLTKDSEPVSYYADGRVNKNIMVTTNALDKHYEKLFAALDFLYGEEGAIMTKIGLNKAQYQELKDAGITHFYDMTINLTEAEQQLAGVTGASHKLSEIGAYYPVSGSNGKYAYWHGLEVDNFSKPYELALTASVFYGLSAVSKLQYIEMSEARREAEYEIWGKYSNKGYIDRTIPTKLSANDSTNYVRNYNSLVDYMSAEVPKFIKGERKLTTWSSFTDDLVLKGCNKNTKLLQSVFTSMEG